MTQFRKKPVVVDAITFAELVQHGRDNGANIVNGMPWSFSYKGHAITHENDERYIIPTLEGNHNFTPNDMLITGVQGEIYPCKLDIFAATYEAANTTSGLPFGLTVEALKKGARVARAGWNGKGMWLRLVEPGAYDVGCGTVGYQPGQPESKIDLLPWIGMKTADGKFVPWLASQTDVLADDWMILPA